MDNLEVKRANPLLEKSCSFALSIVQFTRKVQTEEKEFILTKQLLRSGTAIGALLEEAQQAESRVDFIHKLSIANKEAHYWLRLIRDSEINRFEVDELIKQSAELKKLLISIIKSSKRN